MILCNKFNKIVPIRYIFVDAEIGDAEWVLVSDKMIILSEVIVGICATYANVISVGVNVVLNLDKNVGKINCKAKFELYKSNETLLCIEMKFYSLGEI